MGLDLSSGSFSAIDASTSAGAIVDTAQGFLDGLATAPTDIYDVSFLLSPASQDLVTARRIDSPAAAVPVPASGLLLLSAAGLFMARRKKA